MDDPPPLRHGRTQVLLRVLLAVATVLMVLVGIGVFHFLNSRKNRTETRAIQPSAVIDAAPEASTAGDFAQTNIVSVQLGENESGQGLVHVARGDGATSIESIDGTLARVLRLVNNRRELYFYFRIDPTFKQQDVRRVKIEVEYFDPEPGLLGVHYDALDAPDATDERKRAYKEAASAVSLSGSRSWRQATFHTRNDAGFSNRQNGQADFRVFAQTTVLYVRRVTVTREAVLEESWPVNFSTSNEVSVLLGQETSRDGLRHIDTVGDGRTSMTNLDGVPCRYLNRLGARSPWGSLYFKVSPSFKGGPMEARIDVEYLAPHSNAIRVQYDGLENGRRGKYLSALPVGTTATRTLNRNLYAIPPTNGVWSVATFQITNAVFENSQNGDADFRIEVAPPEIYVRRVTVTRGHP